MSANNVLLGFPIYSDVGVLVTPTFDSGSWLSALPPTNLQGRRLAAPARSSDAALSSTRLRCDLKQDRAISVIHLPKHTISINGKARVLGVPSSLLFDYEAGDDVMARGGTFSRTGTATYVDSAGVLRTAATGVIRDAHFIGGIRTVLLEATRINICKQSENFGTTWVAAGTPTRVAASHTASGVTLDLIGDDDAAAREYYAQTIGFTGDAVKAVSVFVKQGTSTSVVVRIRDTTAGADRLLAAITWNGAVPVITMTTGTSFGSVAYADGVYRILLATASVTAANTNELQVNPATNAALSNAAVGTVYAGGVMVEDAIFPSSYIPTTTVSVTRNTDFFQLPFTATPQAMTADVRFVERGSGLDTANQMRVFYIGANGAGNARLIMDRIGGQTKYRIDNIDAAGAQAQVADLVTTAYGDVVELRAPLFADGSVNIGETLNGGAESVSVQSAALSIPGAWSAQTITINSDPAGGTVGFIALQYIRFAAGSANSLATMQGIVYDSGWVDVWPQVYPTGSLPVGHPSYTTGKITAEDAVGYKMGLTVIPSSPFVGRYWSLQIDDSGNAAGYIDLSRLIVAGGWRPSLNLTVGAKLGWETSSARIQSDGDGALYRVRPRRRAATIELDDLPDDEWLVDPLEIQRRLGISGQLVFVYDTTDTYHLHRRSFLAVLRELSPIALATVQHGRVPLSVVEEV